MEDSDLSGASMVCTGMAAVGFITTRAAFVALVRKQRVGICVNMENLTLKKIEKVLSLETGQGGSVGTWGHDSISSVVMSCHAPHTLGFYSPGTKWPPLRLNEHQSVIWKVQLNGKGTMMTPE